MSREILFKAKRLSDGEWVEGNLFIDDKGSEAEILIGYTNYRIAYKIDKETICQYTGLTDKNGNKIWENDVVTFPDCEMSTESGYGDCFTNVGKIAYDTISMSYFITDRVVVDMDDIDIQTEVEVIGNVFDNSELLKGEPL